MSAIVHRALVTYSSTSTGEIRVKIPALTGISSEMTISYIGRSSSNDYWAVPKIGDQIVVSADDTNLTNLFWIQTEPYNPGTKEPTGFSKASDSSISFDSVTRTFTISPIDGVYEVWVRGVKYEITESKSIVITNTVGGHNIYFDAAGELQTKTTFFDLEWEAPVSYIYWTGSEAIVFADERHGTTMDWSTHEYFHRTQGAQYASGFNIYNYTTSGTGSTTADLKLDISNGTFYDEDLQVDITHSATPIANTWQQRLQGGAYLPVYYYNSSAWFKTTATQYPVKFNTTYPQYNLNGTSLAEMTNNRYGISWIAATNNLNEPVIVIMGQAEYSNISGAQAAKWSDLIINQFPVYEIRPLWKVVFQAITGTAVKAAIREVEDIRTSVKSTVSGATGLITTSQLADNAVTSAKIADGTIVEGDIADGAITSAKILDGTIATGDIANNAVTQTKLSTNIPLSGLRNRIINGTFDIWQRGTSFSNPASGDYTADRWKVLPNGTGTTITVSRQTFTPGSAPVPGAEGTYFIRYNMSAAGTGNSINWLQQNIEDVRTFAAQTVTVSFWAKADSPRTVRVEIGQYFGPGGSGGTYSFSNVTVNTAWARYQVTLSIGSIAGKTITTNHYTYVRFALPTDTTFTVDIWGVQAESGSQMTPFEQRPIGVELSLCQRYFVSETTQSNVLVPLYGNANGQTISFPVKMRISPVVSSVGTTTLYTSGGGTATAAPNGIYNNAMYFRLTWSGNYVYTEGQSFTANAEL